MPYKSEEEYRLAVRERMRRMRERKKGVTNNPVTPDQNVTPTPVTPSVDVTPVVTPKIPEEAKKYPAIIHALTDPERRRKMQDICLALDHEIHTSEGRKLNLLDEVRYGMQGPTLDVVSKWLEVTA